MADIEAMYYQVLFQEHHRDFLRFLWWPQDVSQTLEVYRMNVDLLGAVSSPSIVNFVLQHTAVDNSVSAEVLNTINYSFHVDHFLKCVASVEEATILTVGRRKVCAEGGFTLMSIYESATTVRS